MTSFFHFAPAELPPEELKLAPPTPASLSGFDLVYDAFSSRWGGRVASLRSKPGSSVHGLLYSLTPAQLSKIEKWRAGEKELEVSVLKTDVAEPLKAIAFTTPKKNATSSGEVSEAFVQALIKGAEHAHFPAEYLNRLKAEEQILKRVQQFGRSRAATK